MRFNIGIESYSSDRNQDVGCDMCWVQVNDLASIDTKSILATLLEAMENFRNDVSDFPIFPMHDIIYMISRSVGKTNPVTYDRNLQYYGAKVFSQGVINPKLIFSVQQEEASECRWFRLGTGSLDEKARALSEFLYKFANNVITRKTYVFRTPSNEKIEVDSDIYSFFREIITVNDLKFLFTSKERMYSMDAFELAFFNKATKQKEVLKHDLKLSELQIDEYLVIHVNVPKATFEPDFAETRVIVVESNPVAEIVVDPVDTNTEEKVVKKKLCIIS